MEVNSIYSAFLICKMYCLWIACVWLVFRWPGWLVSMEIKEKSFDGLNRHKTISNKNRLTTGAALSTLSSVCSDRIGKTWVCVRAHRYFIECRFEEKKKRFQYWKQVLILGSETTPLCDKAERDNHLALKGPISQRFRNFSDYFLSLR